MLGTIDLPSDHKTLYFTPNRVIVAKTGGKAGYLFGGIGAGITAYREQKKREELRKLSPESVLRADKHNFAIPYSDILRVEMKKKRFSGSICLIAGHKFGKDMKKKDKTTAIDVYRYEKAIAKKGFEDCVDCVRSVLPEKLSIIE
jgi:hypothetical protein